MLLTGIKEGEKDMNKSRKNAGSISVYLILIFAVLLSFILLIVEGARKNAIRMKIECAMDLSMSSIFAEYNRELLNQYDLFFIDLSYGQSSAGIDNVAEHLKGYLNDNFEVSKTFGNKKDLLDLKAEEITITDFSLASDSDGLVLKKQAVSYMKDLYGISYFDELQNQINTIQENALLSRDIEAERQANQSTIDQYPLPKKKVANNQWEDVELNNPADAVNATRGILSFVLPEEAEISTVGINPSNYLSERNCNKGSSLAGRKGLQVGDEWIFNEYILKKSGNYTQIKENSELQYETEYVLHGKKSDIENLKATVEQLLLLRETANYVFLCSDPGKSGEAGVLAGTIALAALSPELEEPIRQTILFAWAYAESVYDVRVLLSGGKIPLMKTNENWHYSLSEMVFFATDSNIENPSMTTGMSYTDYLRVFLALEKTDTKTKRFMNLVEMDIRRVEGNRFFRLDTCVDYVEAEAFISSGYGANYSILRSYAYED